MLRDWRGPGQKKDAGHRAHGWDSGDTYIKKGGMKHAAAYADDHHADVRANEAQLAALPVAVPANLKCPWGPRSESHWQSWMAQTLGTGHWPLLLRLSQPGAGAVADG